MKSTTILLPKPPHFDFSECLWFLDRGFDDCMHAIQEGCVLKAITVDDQSFAIKLCDEGRNLRVTAMCADRLGAGAQQFVEEWLDLDRNLQPFYDIKSVILNELQRRYFGLRLVRIPDLFEALCWSIIGQQINLTFAYRLKRRLAERYGRLVEFEGQRLFLWPSPSTLADVSRDELRELQFSRQKADYLISIAHVLSKGELNLGHIAQLDDTASMSRRLQQLRGVGEWTANYVLMKTLGRMDSVPHGDAGLINGIKALLNLSTKPNRQQVSGVLEQAAGWEAYLVLYVWRSLSEPPSAVSTG